MTDEQRLILQIFPRSDPSRAVSYSGDQDYIREILRDLARRLEETGPADGARRSAVRERIRLLDAEEEEETGGDDA